MLNSVQNYENKINYKKQNIITVNKAKTVYKLEVY